MGINLVTYYNSTVTPQDDALIYENALPASGMIYGGNVTIKNANTLHVTAGHGALCGRKFTLEETDVPVILTSSGTLNGRLYIHMDLSDTGSPISLEVERAASLTPVIQQSNVNINDGIYEINLATFQISTSTISNLVYVAPFIKYEFAKEVIIAPVEKTSTASTAYAVGKHLIYNDILYRVTTAISSGGQINPGTNCVVSETIQNQIETNAGNISTANTNITNLSNNKTNQTVIATRQANLTASKAYSVGEQFIYNNTLYKATSAIAKNATITIGGNASAADSITSQISNINNNLGILVSDESHWPSNNGVAVSAGTLGTVSSITLPKGIWLILACGEIREVHSESNYRVQFNINRNNQSNTLFGYPDAFGIGGWSSSAPTGVCIISTASDTITLICQPTHAVTAYGKMVAIKLRNN